MPSRPPALCPRVLLPCALPSSCHVPSRPPALCPHVLLPCALTSSCLVPSRPPAVCIHVLLPCALTSSCLVSSRTPALCPHVLLPCALTSSCLVYSRPPALCPHVLLPCALTYSCLVPLRPAVVCVVGQLSGIRACHMFKPSYSLLSNELVNWCISDISLVLSFLILSRLVLLPTLLGQCIFAGDEFADKTHGQGPCMYQATVTM